MKSVDKRMIKARASLVIHQPFFGVLSLNLKMVETTKVETMATDGSHLWYSKSFLDELHNEELTIGCIAHEVQHCALKHHLRRNGRDPELWNEACDHVINLGLRKHGFKLPSWVYCDKQYDGLRAEDVYNLLLDQKDKQQQSQPQPQQGDDGGDDGKSSGKLDEESDESEKGSNGNSETDADSGMHSDSLCASDSVSDIENDDVESCDPGRCGGVLDATEDAGEAAELENEWDIAVSQAIGAAKRAGNLPGAANAIIDQLKNPKADWRAVLRQFMDPSSRKDYSWARPNRRFAGADYVLPGLVTDGVNHIGVVLDASGSTNQFQQSFVSELQGCLDEGGVDRFTVLYCDTEVYAVDHFDNGDQIVVKPMRNGGTWFAPAFDWFAENEPGVSGIVYFTDMFCADWETLKANPSPTKTLWACYGDTRQLRPYMASVPFGECIALD
jgi:predicted metal-dependent peptidase